MTPRKGSLFFLHLLQFDFPRTHRTTETTFVATLVLVVVVLTRPPEARHHSDHINLVYPRTTASAKMCQNWQNMVDAFGKRPFPWQKAIITHLNLMTCPTSGIPASPTFLCAPTGGGKSIARDSFAAGQGNVSWCISPLLSLGADQVIKINANSANGDGAVVAFHLDHYRQPAQQRSICQRISQITGVSNTTVCITSSPQALVNNKLYYGLYRDLLRNDLLKLLTVDGLQLFVSYAALQNDCHASSATTKKEPLSTTL
jgi:hypothetical protein